MSINNKMLIKDIEDLAIDAKRNVKRETILCKKIEMGEVENIESFVPCSYKIYMKTWGCTHNGSDGEYMLGLLKNHGFCIVENENEADLWILNSCTVKNPSEDSFKNRIKTAKSRSLPIVLTGCVPQADPNAKFIYGISTLGINQIDRIVEVVEETLKGNTVKLLEKTRNDGLHVPLNLPKIRRNPYVEIIAISTGCLNNCTYCKTKHSRGELGSYRVKEIVDRAIQSFKEGVVEIWITSEDTGAYGKDIGSSLPELLEELIKITPDYGMIRVGMTNPPYILEHMESMAKILSHPRVYSFLHIPVQSGSDNVLTEMKREYNIEEFCSLVDYMRENVANINIATDIICAFPTETEEDFEETIKIVKKYKFHSLFINQFYPRPGTIAAKMTQIPGHKAKYRTKTLSEIFKSYTPYTDRIGQIYDVLIVEHASDKKHLVGHNKFYEQILIDGDESMMGKWVKVKISETSKFYMKAVLLQKL